MKTITLVVLLINTIYANFFHWQSNYNKALQSAKDSNKTLLILVIKKDDNKTQSIIKEAFFNKTYIEHLNKNYIGIIAQYEGKESYPIEIYYTTKFPTLFFVNIKKETFFHKPLYGKEIKSENLKLLIGD